MVGGPSLGVSYKASSVEVVRGQVLPAMAHETCLDFGDLLEDLGYLSGGRQRDAVGVKALLDACGQAGGRSVRCLGGVFLSLGHLRR